jgi:hypothetical protein
VVEHPAVQAEGSPATGDRCERSCHRAAHGAAKSRAAARAALASGHGHGVERALATLFRSSAASYGRKLAA